MAMKTSEVLTAARALICVKLTVEQVKLVLSSPLSNKRIAQEFGVAPLSIGRIRHGKMWVRAIAAAQAQEAGNGS